MGADLYIESVYNKNRAKYKPLFDSACAFRDTPELATRLLHGATLHTYFTFPEGEKLLLDKGLDRDQILGYLEKSQEPPLPTTDQALVELFYEAIDSQGYFRDSYNSTGLFRLLNLSWWQDVTPKLNEEGKLPLEHVRWLVGEIERRHLALPTIDELRASYASCTDEEELKEWHNYFIKKKEKLLDFLNQCLLLGEEPRMSL